MRIIQIFIFIMFWTAFIIAPLNAFACTIFTVQRGETVMFASNEDQKPNRSLLVVDKEGKFGVVYFATPLNQWRLFMQMGINEKGLCYDINWIPEESLNPHPERKPKRNKPIVKLMREATNVEDVLSKIFTYNWGESISYQIHFADKSGDAVVIHPGEDGELTYTRKKKGNGYLVSTNFNLSYLKNYDWFCERRETANTMLSTINEHNDVAVEFLASVLSATHQDKYSIKTLYSVIYDLQNLHIYLYYNRQFKNPYVFDVNEELKKTFIFKRKVSIDKLVSTKN